MKIGVSGLSEITIGKHNVKDVRLDQMENLVKSKKKTYVQVEVVGENALLDADEILVLKENRTDLILKDLEFIETRMSRATDEVEKALLNKLKAKLEKEEFIFGIELNKEEKQRISEYGLLTVKPVVEAQKQELEDLNSLLSKALIEGGFISFLTIGEKESRAWLIKQGTNAWEAAGVIHSDIQKGFIRAEVISGNDYIQAGGENPAKQAGKMRLEQKEYIMQDADVVNFRFNK